jgi:hypothetical protein
MPRRRDRKTSDIIFLVEQQPYLPTSEHLTAACNLIRKHTGAWKNKGGKGRSLDMGKLCGLIQFNLDQMAQGVSPRATYVDPKVFMESRLYAVLGTPLRRWKFDPTEQEIEVRVKRMNEKGTHIRYMRLAHDIAWIIVSEEWQESITPTT